jgi:cytidylate kinase
VDSFFQKYFEESFRNSEVHSASPPPPIVTLSRECGCPSKLIGQMLVKELSGRQTKANHPQWRFINKEVLEEAARELHMPETQVSSLLTAQEKGVFLDLITFSNTYGGALRVRKILQQVVKDFAARGYLVIVGRAGVALLRDYPNTLHIRLAAPLDWRVAELARIKGIPMEEARKMAIEVDAKRTKLIETLMRKKLDSSMFDMGFNCKYLTPEEIVHSIIHMMFCRKMI